jgi:CheY-like chemotaxis protein
VLLELCGAYLVLERETSGRRTLTVEKTRSGAGAAEKVEFAIGPGGTHLVEDADLVPARRSDPAPATAAPAAASAPAAAAPPPTEAAPPKRPVVLVVDDSRLQRELFREWLGERYEVVVAADGFEAMAALLAQKPDLLILDLIMPRVTGYELLCALRRASLDVPVLVSSSKVASAGDRLGPLVLGATDFLAKPVNRLELEHKVDTLLRLRRENDRRFDAGEAEALFGKVTSSRLLDAIEFGDRLARACSFGERHGLLSSLVVVNAPDAESLDRWIDVANGELRFEDAILRASKQRALVLLVATAAADAPKVTDRLVALADESGGRPLGISVEILAADASQAEPASLEALADASWPPEPES